MSHQSRHAHGDDRDRRVLSSSGSERLGAPAWDREGSLDEARAQVQARIEEKSAVGRSVMWLDADTPPDQQLVHVAELGPQPLIGSDTALWRWTPKQLGHLSDFLKQADGDLVFVEPTAGLGLRRAIQLAAGPAFKRLRGHNYRRDVPAELRAAGFIVTTQVRLRHRFVGDFVRGEARHFDEPGSTPR